MPWNTRSSALNGRREGSCARNLEPMRNDDVTTGGHPSMTNRQIVEEGVLTPKRKNGNSNNNNNNKLII